MSITINIAVIILEIIGLWISISDRKWAIFAYYTQISNIITLVSSIVFVMAGSSGISVILRYLSSCMLTMTFLITLFVLVPMGAGFKRMMLSGNGLYHHTLCPILSVTSYILLEGHSHLWMLPTILTFIYGITMLAMNAKGRFDGPYPFFRVHEQSKAATVIWMAVLTGVIAMISIGISKIV
ncbi:MAG: hypothetical protein IJH43_09090 [Mogibacterium sp.]|nr:hypothetical protein [Mogibacterium sp.]